MMSRIVIVSNRLPITVQTRGGVAEVVSSDGGLASAVGYVHRANETLWVGYLGSGRDRELRELAAERHYHPVAIPTELYAAYYDDYSNRALWPLLHGFSPFVEPAETWGAYREVNRRFAVELFGLLRPDDVIWVHDYHLFLLPSLLRRLGVKNRIGFFLHVPFPSPRHFGRLTHGPEIMAGLAEADLVGFQTPDHLKNFRRTAAAQGGEIAETFSSPGRAASFPIGINFDSFASAPEEEALFLERITTLETGPKEVFSLARLDYTKGLIEQLQAIERLVADPKMHGKFRLRLHVIPSRHHLPEYRALRSRIEALAAKINDSVAGVWQPVQYEYGRLSPEALRLAYREAEVMLVTPLADGMNLIAKEYLAANRHGRLILSKFAGAARQLTGATLVDPHHLGQLEAALRGAIAGEPALKGNAEMCKMLEQENVFRWAESFISALRESARE